MNYLAAGDTAYTEGRFLDAAREYATGTAVAPDDGNGWSKLGLALTRAGRGDAALVALRRAVTLSPYDLRSHQMLGEAYLNRDEIENAERPLEFALRLAPDSAASLRLLARVRVAQGRDADAMALYRRVLELDPFDSAARRALEALERDATAGPP